MTTLAIPYDAYADKITASVPRGKGPDVFIYAQDRLGGWIESGKTVEPIGFYMDEATQKQFLPGMMDAMTYKGTVYGLPLNYKSITLIYNKALVKNPPKTSTELVKLAKSLTNADSGRYGLAYWYTNFYFHAALMNAFGGRVFDKDGKLVLNSPADDRFHQADDEVVQAGRHHADGAFRNAGVLDVQRGQGGHGVQRPVVHRRDFSLHRFRSGGAAGDR